MQLCYTTYSLHSLGLVLLESPLGKISLFLAVYLLNKHKGSEMSRQFCIPSWALHIYPVTYRDAGPNWLWSQARSVGPG